MRALLTLLSLLLVATGSLRAAVYPAGSPPAPSSSPPASSPAPAAAPSPAGAAAPSDAARASGGTALITIDRQIDDGENEYLERALAQAVAAGSSQIIIHFVTDGGTLNGGRHMLGDLLGMSEPRPRLIAMVDDHCYSAGALIAYGCDQIWLSKHATIGDIGVIMQKSDGTIEYAPEKMESVVRGLLRSAAQSRGWDAAKLQKMTARNQELYRFDLGHGDRVFVLQDDLPKWLADHPKVEEKSKVVIAGADRLLVYTGQDAVDEHMATGIAPDLAALEAKMHVDPSKVLNLSPTSTETTAWALSGWAPLLAAAAVLCIVLEFKFGGTGLFLVLGLVCGCAFIACQYYQALASSTLEVLLMLGGLVLIGVELFVFPTAGWLLILGCSLGILGLILAFMPDADKFQPGSPLWGDELMHAMTQSLLALVTIVVGMIVVLTALPRSRAMRLLACHGAITATVAYRRSHRGPRRDRLGEATGVARTALSLPAARSGWRTATSAPPASRASSCLRAPASRSSRCATARRWCVRRQRVVAHRGSGRGRA